MTEKTMTEKTEDRCPARLPGGGYNPRTMRCQGRLHHEGRCSYYRRGSQGGTLVQWWGANARPDWFIDDLSGQDRWVEVLRLRALCDAAGIDWRADVTRKGRTA